MKRLTSSLLQVLPETITEPAISAHLALKRRRLRDLETPTVMILYVTSKCNLRCGHCFYWDSLNRKAPELTVDEIHTLVASLCNPVSLSLTGGEPFLRKDLGDIVRSFMVHDKARDVAIATNGHFTKDTTAFCRGFLKQYPGTPVSVQVSLDGLKVTHDGIRGVQGSFDRALATIDELLGLRAQHAGLAVSAGVAIQKRNLEEISDLIDLLASRRLDIRIILIRGESLGTFGVTHADSSHVDPKDGSDIALNAEELRALRVLLKAKNELYGFWSKRSQRAYDIGLEVIEHRRKVIDCYAGTVDVVIYPNGDVAFCELTKAVGNLHDYGFDLRKLWRSAEADAMRRRVSRCFCTHGCNISTSLMMSDPAVVREAFLQEAGVRGGRGTGK